MTITLFKRKSAVAKMLSVLRKYGSDAHLYLPGVGVINGITAGNYLDSTGTTPTSVDGNVGLVLDGAGSVGAELLPSYDMTSVSWSAIGTPTSVVQNGFTNASGTTAGLVISAAFVGLVQGKTYKVSVPFTKSEASSVLSVRIASGIDVASSTALSGVITGITVAGTTGLQLRYANNGTVTFGAISVKEVTGIHASQATTGYQPKLRRGVVNLLTYSNDLSNVAWSKNAVSVAANKIVADTSTGYHSTSRGYVVPAGTNQTLTFLLSSAEYSKARLSDNSSGEWYCSVDLSTGAVSASGGARLVSADAVKLSDGNVLAAVAVTGNGVVKGHAVAGYPNSGATLGIYGAQYTGDGVSGIYLYSMGIIQGALTAQQILAAGGIPLTTTAPASSNVGAYYWEFDGAGDSLVLNSLPFTLSDDHCVVAAGRANDSADIRTFFTNSGTDITRVCQVYIANATGYPTVLWRDSANSANGFCVDTVNRVGQFIVISGRKVGNQLECAVNGAVKESKTVVLGASAPVAATIGANTALGGYYHKGDLGGVIVTKGTVTPADTLTLSRGLNALSGYAAGRF